MRDEVLRSRGWVGLAVGIAVAFMVLEVLFRIVTNRFGTPQDHIPTASATNCRADPSKAWETRGPAD